MTPDQTIDELARLLFAYVPGSRSTRVVTADITQTITAWAHARGWSARTEARVKVPDGGAERLGFVDVLVLPGDGQPGIAIEIDSADKPWSLVKLRYAAAAGMRPVWVRWGDQDWAVAHTDVDVIQLPATRSPAPSGSDAQLGLWP